MQRRIPMPGEVVLWNDPADSGLDEAEACVQQACTRLVRGNPSDIEGAAAHLRQAIAIFTGWQRQPAAKPSLRRLELHKSVQRAGRLIEAIGGWCRHRRCVLFPEEATPRCYGSDGRAVAAPVAGTMTLRG